MECNKEDAIKAKELAEKKMQNGDFSGARRIGMKAQRLYPDLDNIAQLLTVCDVHCAAENKLNGLEMDWYGILQIERSSDESVVKKQFRKLALSLHPDKNKLPGAEAAFKLIGEANRVLTDTSRCVVYNGRYGGVSIPTQPKPNQSNHNTFVKKQHPAADNSYKAPEFMRPNSYQQPQEAVFWTRCPPCNMWYQYQSQYKKKMLKCQNCFVPFIAHDLGTPLGSFYSKFVIEKRFISKSFSQFVALNNAGLPSDQRFTEVPLPKAGKAADTAGSFQSKEVKMKNVSEVGKDSKLQEKINGHVDVEAGKRGGSSSMHNGSKTMGSVNVEGTSNKRSRKPTEKSSEFFDRGTSDGKENGSNLPAQKSQLGDDHQSKRSSKNKPNITSDKKIGDDDFVVPPKRSKVDDLSILDDKEMKEVSGYSRSSKRDPSIAFTPVVLNAVNNKMKQKARSGQDDKPSNKKSKISDCKGKGDGVTGGVDNKNEKSKIGADKLNLNAAPQPDIYVFPDPDFSNFEKEREESSFAVNQIWAVYDSLDSMPRFYAKIREVINPGFKLQITWLETNSNKKAERKWANSGLPVACGRFVSGETDLSEDNLMFSHKMRSVHSGLNGCYFVYPNKGETWALYKNWDLQWSAEPDKHIPPFDFDIVEILTEYIEDVGIGVGYLGKVKGFISIFQRDIRDEVVSFTIRPNELYKFSHQVPSFRMTGREGEGVPVGSFELDTAALPSNFHKLVDNDKISSAKKNLESSAKTETKSPEISSGKGINDAKADDKHTKEDNGDNVVRACQEASEKFTHGKKAEKNKFTVETMTPRRSPRDLGKGSCQIHANRSTDEAVDHKQSGDSADQPEDTIDLDVGMDERLGNSRKGRKSSGSRVIEVEAYDFEKEKTEDKFQVDQIWAILRDEDGLPKIYCQVKKIDRSSGFRLHVAMLKNIKNTTQPLSCGIFKVANGQPVVLPLTAFSHLVKARPIGKDAYEIWPKQGEIWAVKRNSDSGGECDIVEVVEDNNRSVKVAVLEEKKEKIFVTPKGLKCVSMEIRRGEFADRFSHQCLAFHMGDEDKRLKGSWQLDPRSIPGSIIVVE